MENEKQPLNKEEIKSEIEAFYVKRLSEIEESIRNDVFQNTEIGKFFEIILYYFPIPTSEGDMAGILFSLYNDYKHEASEASFNNYLERLMDLYIEFLSKYEKQIEEWKLIEGGSNETSKRLHEKTIKFDDVLSYLQQELNRYEVYHDMTITKIDETKTKTIKETHLSAPERFLTLEQIGLNELPFVKNLNDSEYKILISTILNYDKRSIDGYINNRKESSSESKYIITDKHTENTEKFLKQFLKK